MCIPLSPQKTALQISVVPFLLLVSPKYLEYVPQLSVMDCLIKKGKGIQYFGAENIKYFTCYFVLNL